MLRPVGDTVGYELDGAVATLTLDRPQRLNAIVPALIDDLEAALDRAVRAGATPETEIRTGAWGRIVTVADPFGHGLCLIQFLGRGYDEVAEPA